MISLTKDTCSRDTLANSESPITLAVDTRLFRYAELSERGIGHYVLPHLRAILESGLNLRTTFLIDNRDSIPEIVGELASEFHCRLVTIDEAQPEQFDIAHLPDLVTLLPGYDSPLRCRPPATITTGIFYDLIPLKVPDQHIDRWDPRSCEMYRNRLAQVAAHRCHLFSISECTKRDVVTFLGVHPDTVTTIFAGRNFSDFPSSTFTDRSTLDVVSQRFRITGPFFLIVGAIEKHKNFPLALEAFSIVRQQRRCQLVIVGSFNDPFKEAYRDLCQKQGISDVIFTGFLDKGELTSLYSSATAVLGPSLYEGFGFPALEAMERGSPIIASNAASLPEVVGDAGILLSPHEPAAWAESMRHLIDYPEICAAHRARGFAQAQRFSWRQNASMVIATWQRLLSEERGDRRRAHEISSIPLTPPN